MTPSMAAPGVRLARTSDVDDIAAIQVASWRQRFAAILPPDLLAGLSERDVAGTWATSILLPPTPRHRVLVAVDADRAAGFAALGPAGEPDGSAQTAELVALDVAPDQQSRGHGSRLLTAAIDHARELGFDEVIVWHAVADESRRAFLATAGWGPDGAYRDLEVAAPTDADVTVVREVRLVATIT